MTTIKLGYGSGGSGLRPDPTGSAEHPGIDVTLRDIADDLAALRTSITGITAKLDADAGVTDTNYAALHNPAALLTIKG
jgi:hypothetical protein